MEIENNENEFIEYNFQMANYWKNYYDRLMVVLEEIVKINNI